MAQHRYEISVEWTGQRGVGTRDFRSYSREHVVRCAHGLELHGSADRAFHGDTERWNPEELLLAALTQCHMMSYLHSAAAAGLVVVDYRDSAEATLDQRGTGGRLVEAVLRPEVTLAAGDRHQALALHESAGQNCFIASSVNFPVRCEPAVRLRPN